MSTPTETDAAEAAHHGPVQRSAARVYDKGGWPVTALEDGTGFTMEVEGTDGAWSALAITDDDADRFVFYSLLPVDPAPERWPAMAEALHRINHGLVTAAFEFDHDTGEARLRTGIELITLPRDVLDDDDLLDAIINDLSAANVEIFDRYLSGLVAVSLGADPAEVVAEIEADPDDD
ncbi:YbjN domain-containing protein [Nocardioides carbamazepini]|uniref:YbjN domain-containing protein n=1 Tax=Nocardioides carbamazepini TaxID=2854259 RepID=UPI00214A50E1|nr:YbjN domain-containing protein [Nocardioides carbamazepini]MCR1782750.1 YbjN domain-containing protein [Nocardioides carbamazepini]